MSERLEADELWLKRVDGAGRELLAAFDRAPQWPGQWDALSKPGLGRRRRWRWQTLDGEVFYVKTYLRPTWREQLDRILRQAALHSRAWWERDVARQLGNAYVSAAHAVACAERMRGAWESASVVLLQAASGEALDRRWQAGCNAQEWFTRGAARHELARALGRFIAAFHGTGFCHRDLYLCHVFISLDPRAADPPRFSLIDLARSHRPLWRRTRWLLKDLGQLDHSARQCGVTRADRLRFLLAYLGLAPGSPRVRWYVRRILARSNRTLARAARKAARR